MAESLGNQTITYGATGISAFLFLIGSAMARNKGINQSRMEEKDMDGKKEEGRRGEEERKRGERNQMEVESFECWKNLFGK